MVVLEVVAAEQEFFLAEMVLQVKEIMVVLVDQEFLVQQDILAEAAAVPGKLDLEFALVKVFHQALLELQLNMAAAEMVITLLAHLEPQDPVPEVMA
jgi:hypothetical protein